MSDLSLKPLEQALLSLSKATKEKKTELVRDATIQRFEYTFELSWKTLKRYFKINNNVDIFNVKEVFREAGKQGLIKDVEDWFEYLEARNRTSHTYSQATAEEVYEAALKFEKDAIQLLAELKKVTS